MMQSKVVVNADDNSNGSFNWVACNFFYQHLQHVLLECISNCCNYKWLVRTPTTAQPQPVSSPAETRSDNLKCTLLLMNHFLLKTNAFLLRLIRNISIPIVYFCGSLKLITVSCLFLFCNSAIQAQDKEKYFNHDSAGLYHLSNDSVVNTLDSSYNESESIIADTILVNNGLFIPTDSANAIKKEKAFAYAYILDSLLRDLQLKQDAKYSVNTKRISTIDRFFSARLTKLFFWTIAALLLSFIIVKLFITESFFQRKSASSNVNVLPTNEDAVPDARDYESQIKAAIKKGDFRLATRYLYLQLLYRLIVLGAINFATDKTNHQYVAELATKPYHKAFAALTLQYEYAWYGGFALDESRFNSILQSFIKFTNELPTPN